MLIAALSLFFVGCVAVPASEDGYMFFGVSTDCLKKCFYPEGVPVSSDVEIDSELPDANLHAVFKRGLSSSEESIESYRCDSVSEFAACVRTCPNSRLDSVAQQRTEVFLKACASSRSKEERKAFLKSTGELSRALFMRAMSCPLREHEGDEGVCKDTASCLFGSALDELKEHYAEEVLAAATAEWKLILAFALKDQNSQNRTACSALFEPYRA
ncbi:hypothetical protein AAVH_28254 [Aphelenchoides avenae]|nr:hypothetical protein AAVH_28254 [Aphelenchus avenae]